MSAGRRRASGVLGCVSLVASTALIAGLVTAPPAVAAADAAAAPASSDVEPVEPSPRSIDALPADPAAVTAPGESSVLPTPGARQVEVSAQPVTASADAVLTVVAADPAELSRPAAPPDDVRVEVLDTATREQLGVEGLAFRLARSDEALAEAPVEVSVDYSSFGGWYGGNWASRLRLFEVPECALTRPADPGCQAARELPATNDVAGARLTAVVQADADPTAVQALQDEIAEMSFGGPDALADPSSTTEPTPNVDPATVATGEDSAAEGSAAGQSAAAPAGGGSLFVMAASTSGGAAGGYEATSLSPSDSWEVGVGSGNFTWSRTLMVPEPIAGPKPDLTLRYSSGSVDGKTTATNAQASWVGSGWDLTIPYIERSYGSCSVTLSNHRDWGDKCWPGMYAQTLVMGGGAQPLVSAGGTQWRTRSDSGMKIEARSGADNYSTGGTYWVATDAAGTEYWFGFGHQKTGGGGGAATNSVLDVPVYGAPGYTSTVSDQPYRWYLDRVVDTHGNLMTWFYDIETNNYHSKAANDPHRGYDANILPERVEYGATVGTGTNFTAFVTFQSVLRCTQNSGPTTLAVYDAAWNTCPSLTGNGAESYPDYPADLVCNSAQSSCSSVTQTSPTFFSRYMLRQVTSYVVTGGAAKPVGSDRFFYSFPDPGDGSGKSLWLLRVQHTGLPANWVTPGGVWTAAQYATPPTGLVNPPIVMTSVGADGSGGLYDNRWTDGSPPPGVLPLKHYRVRGIINELGGATYVDYATGNCPNPGGGSWDSNPDLCFPQWWKPADSPAGFAVFNKYIVTKITERDRATGNPDVVTSYAYDGQSQVANASAAWHYDGRPQNLLPADPNNGYAPAVS